MDFKVGDIIKIKNPFSDDRKTEICSELVGNILIDYYGANIKEDLEIEGPKFLFDKLSRME